MRHFSKHDGIRRCDTCGGVLECAYSERDIVAMCSCPDKRGVRARSTAAVFAAERLKGPAEPAAASELLRGR